MLACVLGKQRRGGGSSQNVWGQHAYMCLVCAQQQLHSAHPCLHCHVYFAPSCSWQFVFDPVASTMADTLPCPFLCV
jgi:hypothetical protein